MKPGFFEGKTEVKTKNIIFEYFLKVEKTPIFAFLEKTLIHFPSKTKKIARFKSNSRSV